MGALAGWGCMMPSIAIVGAGPSGCYTAQALGKALPEARIDIIDRLPVPYGLIRYGVAPDHQGTKAVTRQFERLFERSGVGFFGNVALGRDIALADLRAQYDAVVLATGLSQDRALGIEGEDLPGVIGAGRITRYWNDHPDSENDAIGLGRKAVIIGNGNVAIDLVRILAKVDGEFEGSDLGGHHLNGFRNASVESIDIIGRSPAGVAKFDPVMLRELAKLTDARIKVISAAGEGKVVEALAAIDGHDPQDAQKTITFRFGWTPARLTGEQQLQEAHFTATDGSGETLVLPCDSLLTAIGFAGSEDVPSPEASEDGFIEPGLYATGWFRRGPRGTIPENRADAQAVAARIAADLASVRSARPGRDGLAQLVPHATDYHGWQRIDAAERTDCPADRCRIKIRGRNQMLDLARQKGMQ
jgi:ferredoxin--NADP+ reductase|tara:strand:- start:122113 stop:123360 length:1248 start_codon:yes stop_codon:yes gene_type:complete